MKFFFYVVSSRVMMGAMFFDQNTKYFSGGAGTAISRAGVKAGHDIWMDW